MRFCFSILETLCLRTLGHSHSYSIPIRSILYNLFCGKPVVISELNLSSTASTKKHRVFHTIFFLTGIRSRSEQYFDFYNHSPEGQHEQIYSI